MEGKKSALQAITFTKLADAARIQRSYMSQVINGLQHLSADQLYLVAKALHMTLEETEFLLLILEIERCAVAERKSLLEEKKLQTRAKHRKSEKYFKSSKVILNDDSRFLYYSDFLYTVVHMFLLVKKFQKQPELLCDKLKISKERLSDALEILERCEVVRFEDGQYHVNEIQIHLPDSSKIAALQHQQFRLKAIEAKREKVDKDGYFFSASFSADEEARQFLKKELLNLIQRFEAHVQKAESKDVFQINLDLFRY